jgi:hypothetical protein
VAKILVVDDEPALVSTIGYTLGRGGALEEAAFGPLVLSAAELAEAKEDAGGLDDSPSA